MASPVGEVTPSRDRRPGIALLDDASVSAEANQRRSSNRFDRTVRGRDRRPPVDRCAIPFDDRLAETALRHRLLAEHPVHVLLRHLPVAKRVRVENRVVRVEGGERVRVARRPRARPGVYPRTRSGSNVYFATSMARLSRITMTLTWPGYSSWSSISRAISCESSTAASSSISLGSTITRISRPACSA